METGGHAVDVLPVGSVPVELFNAIRRSTVTLLDRTSQSIGSIERANRLNAETGTYLEAKWVFVTRPDTGVRVEEQTFLVLLRNVFVHVLGDSELAMELWYKSSATVVLHQMHFIVPVLARHHSSQGIGTHPHE